MIQGNRRAKKKRSLYVRGLYSWPLQVTTLSLLSVDGGSFQTDGVHVRRQKTDTWRTKGKKKKSSYVGRIYSWPLQATTLSLLSVDGGSFQTASVHGRRTD